MVYSCRTTRSPNGQNGDEQNRNGAKKDTEQLAQRNGGKNGEEQHRKGAKDEDDSPLYKFLKENRDLLKNMGGNDDVVSTSFLEYCLILMYFLYIIVIPESFITNCC